MQITQNEMHSEIYKNTIAELLKSDIKEFKVIYADKEMMVPRKYIIFHLHFWWILIKWGQPVTSDFVMDITMITNKTISEFYTRIYENIIDRPDSKNMQYDIWVSKNELHNFILTECQEYHGSISILELCKLMKEPKVKKITAGLKFKKDMAINVVEEKVKIATDKFLKLLCDPTLKHNVLHNPYRLGLLNKMQIPQVMLAIGVRTDINDSIIRYPIESCFLTGLKNSVEYMAESLTAKMSAVYNKSGIPKSQYFSRRQHLVASALKHIYHGDCGTIVTIPYNVHKNSTENLIGKNYVNSNGKIIEITSKNCNDLIGKVIQLRSPITCKHVDGTCMVCGGKMTKYLNENIKIGMASVIEVTNAITQMILSVKHLQNTSSITFVPNTKLERILRIDSDKIYWNDTFKKDMVDIKIGIPIANASNINDLTFIDDVDAISVEHFSNITHLSMRKISDDKEVLAMTPTAKNRLCPYFSREMLIYIKENFHRLVLEDDEIWIPLDNFDHELPPFESLVINDSMMRFVDNIVNFFKSEINTYTSATTALRDLSTAIYKKVNANLFHIEIMLKSYLINGELDFSIPVVEDPDRVMFGTDLTINVNRSLGTFLAYERFFMYIKKPKTFVIPKQESTMDTYLGFDDKTLRRRKRAQ